jgi:hypothetical protein
LKAGSRLTALGLRVEVADLLGDHAQLSVRALRGLSQQRERFAAGDHVARAEQILGTFDGRVAADERAKPSHPLVEERGRVVLIRHIGRPVEGLGQHPRPSAADVLERRAHRGGMGDHIGAAELAAESSLRASPLENLLPLLR